MPWPGENSPSPFRRGTTCTWTCGTLWLIRVFTAMKEPSAPSAPRKALELVDVPLAHERARHPGLAGAPGAADAVGERIRVLGQVVVDDVADVLDVQSARGEVGGDEHFNVAAPELVQRPLPLTLREIAVDRRDLLPAPLQVVVELVHAALCVTEHEHLIGLPAPQELGECPRL